MESKPVGGFVVEDIIGFTGNGVLDDAYGGGCTVLPYNNIPVEDLLKIESLLKQEIAQLE